MNEHSNLAEAHDAIDNLVRSVTNILGIAADDVDDRYDDSTLVGMFHRLSETPQEKSKGSHVDSRIARRFAEALVLRLIYEPEIVFAWDDESTSGLVRDTPGFHDKTDEIDPEGVSS